MQKIFVSTRNIDASSKLLIDFDRTLFELRNQSYASKEFAPVLGKFEEKKCSCLKERLKLL